MNITALLNSWQRKPTNREGGERFETKKLQDGRRKYQIARKPRLQGAGRPAHLHPYFSMVGTENSVPP